MKKLLYVLAAVGLFAACQPEEIQTAFEVNPAKVIVNVRAKDINTQKPVMVADLNLTNLSVGEVVGETIEIVGNKTISAQNLTGNWDYDGASGDFSLPIPAVRAGGQATLDLVFIVGTPVVDQTITVSEPVFDEKSAMLLGRFYFNPASGHALVEHDGMMWAKNLTEFMLTGTVTYDSYTGCERDDFEVYNDVYAAQVEAKSYLYDFGLFAEPMKAEIKVSAWSYYTAYTEVYAVPGYYEVYAEYAGKKECVGKVTIYGYYTRFEYEEIANPEGHGHYEYGHGHAHDHGGSDNAGGGIVVAE